MFKITRSIPKIKKRKIGKPIDLSAINTIPKNNVDYFVVIDVETNIDNQVMSIGVAIAEKETYKLIVPRYYVLNDVHHVGFYGSEIELKKHMPMNYKNIEWWCNRTIAINEINKLLKIFNITDIFAYNASFDHGHLHEFHHLSWYDIMPIARNINTNKHIPKSNNCFNNGSLKKGYGVENILRLITGDDTYFEKHNAVCDAIDELKIMELLNHSIDKYKK